MRHLNQKGAVSEWHCRIDVVLGLRGARNLLYFGLNRMVALFTGFDVSPLIPSGSAIRAVSCFGGALCHHLAASLRVPNDSRAVRLSNSEFFRRAWFPLADLEC